MTEVLSANFALSVEPQAGVVRIVMGGFFSQADIATFRVALGNEMRTLECAANDHLTLCDISAMKIQAQEIVGAFSQIVGHPQFRSKRLAFVTGSSLARLQARRLTDREDVKFFTDSMVAEAWLLG